jgi:ketosteroid isomerase-like protein
MMGDAREVMDRITDALVGKDFDAAAACYSENAVAVTPDQGEIRGREAIIEYFKGQTEVFPDSGYESLRKLESANVAIDEGYFTGTHTAPLPLPSGETLPPTGKQFKLRACDIASVEGGLVTEHIFYWDQMGFLGQLGLLPETLS